MSNQDKQTRPALTLASVIPLNPPKPCRNLTAGEIARLRQMLAEHEAIKSACPLARMAVEDSR